MIRAFLSDLAGALSLFAILWGLPWTLAGIAAVVGLG